MLLSGDVVKLADFGLSKLLPLGKHYKSSKIVGTPVFSAPEVLSGDGLGTRKSCEIGLLNALQKCLITERMCFLLGYLCS